MTKVGVVALLASFVLGGQPQGPAAQETGPAGGLPMLRPSEREMAMVAEQEGGLSHRPTESIDPKILAEPTTTLEAATTFQKVETALRRVVLVDSTSVPLKSGDSSSSVTRNQVVDELDRLFEMCRPKFKFTPRLSEFDGGVLSIPADQPQRAKLEKLIAWGCVGRVAPLATSKETSIGLADFGDAVGLFLARMADLTHSPSSQWSPYMNAHGG
ncbi:MAG: hypothetical protein L6Q31_07160 [Fimbriimonadaceae bacterium]|nr:hypothetical protein [Fimbriimonadaceae bacterium]NUM39013.1 hypothetical protein [Armatimonadota bacterium]